MPRCALRRSGTAASRRPELETSAGQLQLVVRGGIDVSSAAFHCLNQWRESLWYLTESGFATESTEVTEYKEIVIKGQRLDLLVGGQVVVELKSVSRLPEVAVAQTLSYLKATRLKAPS